MVEDAGCYVTGERSRREEMQMRRLFVYVCVCVKCLFEVETATNYGL